jgi:Family of unknown function (DUF6263)
MSLRCTLGAGFLLLTAALTAQAQTTLEWKFKEGDKFYMEAVTEVKQKVALGDKPAVTIDTTYTTISSFVVKKAKADSYTLERTIEGVQVKSSKPDDPATPVVSRWANLPKKASFTFTIDPSGKIIGKLDGYDELMKKFSGGNEAVEQSNRAGLPENLFKEELNDMFGFLPGKAVSKGDTWTRPERIALRFGKLAGDATYTYQGKGKDGEQIDVSHKWTYTAPTEPVDGLKISKGDLKVAEASASIVVDPEAGRLVRNKQDTHITGQLTLTDAAKKDISFSVDQTITRTVRRVDQNPLNK